MRCSTNQSRAGAGHVEAVDVADRHARPARPTARRTASVTVRRPDPQAWQHRCAWPAASHEILRSRQHHPPRPTWLPLRRRYLRTAGVERISAGPPGRREVGLYTLAPPAQWPGSRGLAAANRLELADAPSAYASPWSATSAPTDPTSCVSPT